MALRLELKMKRIKYRDPKTFNNKLCKSAKEEKTLLLKLQPSTSLKDLSFDYVTNPLIMNINIANHTRLKLEGTHCTNITMQQ
jgi:hypothetical protein